MSHKPPRLSMDDYADFVERPLFGVRRDLAERQKRLEERITTPFRFPKDSRSPARSRQTRSPLSPK